MSYRFFMLACACMLLTGCDQITAAFTPTSDKVNRAFPLREDLQTSRNALTTALEGDKGASQAANEQYAKLMELRALTCSAKTSIGRFATVANIKTQITDADCFKKQDVRIAEWVGLKRVTLVLAKPPLVALSGLPAKALLPSAGEYSGQVSVASSANVLLVKANQKYTAIQIPGGKQINSFPMPEQSYKPGVLSPNGRVIAVPIANRSLRMIEVETGNTLWMSEDYTEVLAWLPLIEAAVLLQVNTGAPQLLDIRNGKSDAYPAPEKRLSWALETPGPGGKYLVGTGQTASQIDITRSVSGSLDAAPVKQWKLTSNASGVIPLVMANGSKLVYQSNQDLAWLDMQTDQQGLWQLSVLNGRNYTKLNEQTVMFDSTDSSNGYSTFPRVLDINQTTVALVKNLDSKDGTTIPLTPRNGYLKISGSATLIGSEVESDVPQQLEPLVSEALVARQVAKVEALAARSAAEAAELSERSRYVDSLSRQVRALNVASAIRDGLPRDVIDKIRRGSSGDMNTPYPISNGALPMLGDVPANAKVAFIGVYEGTSPTGTPRGFQNHPTGIVTVVIPFSSVPLVLVLSSYEPVKWNIVNSNRKISAVLISSYGNSSVNGQGNAQVLKIGSDYAYKLDSPQYSRMQNLVARYVRPPIQSFQGSYAGQTFTVQ